MPRSRFRPAAPAACLAAALAFFAGCSSPSSSEPVAMAPVAGGELTRAIALRTDRHFDEATRIFETWLAAHPRDPEPTFDLGYTLYLQACAEPRADVARRLRLRARELALQARKLGAKGVDLIPYDADISADGRDLRSFHTSPEADALMKKGELAFSQGRHADALAAYAAVLAIDPHVYTAALFTGDTYFAMRDYAQADAWFAKAVALDPNRETAYRYWGDSLVRQGRGGEALQHYLEAMVAEPYTRLPQEALGSYARMTRTTIHRPISQRFAAGVELAASGPKISIGNDTDALTLAYAMSRAQWLTEERKKSVPEGSPARHSLAEEAYALRKTIAIAGELAEKNAASVAPWKDTIDALARLDRAGLLEAYVLFDGADAGIAQDYAAYREQHRDVLLRYLREIWFGES